MADLVYEDIPESGRARPKYEQYVPLVEEFDRSLRPSARVRDDVRPAILAGRLKAAIAHSAVRGRVGVATRGTRTYLVRKESQR